MIRIIWSILLIFSFSFFSYYLLKEEKKVVERKLQKKKSIGEPIVLLPLRGNITDADGVELTKIDYSYKVVLKNEDIAGSYYDINRCFVKSENKVYICKADLNFLFDNFDLINLFRTNNYVEFIRVKNFVDLDFDFIGWAAIAEGKQRLLLLRKIIKDLKTRMEDKTLLRNIVPKLKMINFVEGKFGVEKYYDDVLRGKLGIAKKYEDRDVIKIEKVNGKNLHLTLSIVLNNTIKKSLRDFCQKLHTDCVAVGINAENGEVLFLSEVKKENLIESPKQRYFSLSYQGLYPPGSVFKPFVALMLLENHLIEKDTKTYCGGKIKYYNRIFNCWLGSGHGNIDVVSAIEHSCNIFFYNTIQKLNNQSIRSFVKKLKLGKKAKIDLPYEPLPKVTLAVNPLDKTLFSIGQSNVYLPLLKLAQVYSLFYNESYIPIVHLVKNIPKHKGKISIKVSKKNLEIVKSGLYKVVHSPSGTAYGIGLEKYKVYGKTGTVQVGKGLKPHSLFCGVWEGKIPISFCVLIEKVGSSKDYAVKFSATLLKILEEYFR